MHCITGDDNSPTAAMMRPIFLLFAVTLLLTYSNHTVAYPRPFSFSRSVSLVKLADTARDATTLSNKPSLFWKKQQEEKKIAATIKNKLQQSVQAIVEGAVQSGPRIIHHALYWITAFDAVKSVRFNEYRLQKKYFNTFTPPSVDTHSGIRFKGQFVPSVYSRLFYFARLRPRLLYSVGALLRALQLCTPFQTVLDPSAGVGAGVNLCAVLAGSRWVQPFILGWATTKWIWVWLGARKIQGAHLPIKVSIRELESRKDTDAGI